MKIKKRFLLSDLLKAKSKDKPITIDVLKELLSKIGPEKPLILNNTALGISAVSDLFTYYLPNKTLTITSPKADTETFMVNGKLSFSSPYDQLESKVVFTHDGTYVTGIRIRVALPGWEIHTAFLEQSVDFLKDFGCSKLYLLLATAADAKGELQPRFGLGVDFPFSESSPLELNALLSSTNPKASYLLEGSFDSVTVTDFNSLSRFAKGGNFNIIPQGPPISKLLDLKAVRIWVDPELKKLLVVSLDVQIASEWKFIPKLLDFNEIIATFSIIPSNPPSIYAKLFTSFNLGPLPLDAQISVPDLIFEAGITEPIQLSEVLKKFDLSAVSISDLSIDYLRYYIDLRSKAYNVHLATTENWTVLDTITLEQISFTLSNQDSGTSIDLAAILSIAKTSLQISAAYSNQKWLFIGGTLGDATIQIGDLIQYIADTFKLGDIPQFISGLALKNLALTFDTETETFRLNADFTVDTVTVPFLAIVNKDPSTKKWNAEVSLKYTANFNLIQCIPLINQIIKEKISIEEFQIGYKSQSGTDFKVVLQLGNERVELPQKQNHINALTPRASNSEGSSNLSYPVQKTIGPLHLQKIGLGWDKGDLDILLDVSVAAGGLGFNLIGLSIGFPLTNPQPENWHFNLNGLGLMYQTGSIEIAGELIKEKGKDPGVTTYNGALIVKALDFNIMALGSLALGKDCSSLFVFAFLEKNLGGDPSFFITGLSLGFGYNRSFNPPPIDEVASFPLVAGLNDPSYLLGPSAKNPYSLEALSFALEKLDNYIGVQIGEYWIAAGIEFISYELIKTNALLVIEFGKEFEILILGKSFASFPPKLNITYAYIELALEVIFNPGKGFASAQASLTKNSYLLDRACHLTGGFSYDVWFGSNPHSGEFVLTLGGYHPKYKPPNYYPRDPRLGFNWIVDRHVIIKGGVYFALTPSCMMGGGSLEAVYHNGNLRAWFIAHADFLIFWNPFSFEAGIGISIGVSYRLYLLFTTTTLRVELGADLHLWGPPTGGRVHISLWFISFTVSFGASPGSIVHTIDWKEFKQMLPKEKPSATVHALSSSDSSSLKIDSCHIRASHGIIDQIEEEGETRWLVRGDEFTFSIESQIPLTEVHFNGEKISSDIKPLSVRPMGISASLSSTLEIKITSEDSYPLPKWNKNLQNTRSSAALWGTPVGKPGNINPNEQLVNALVGVNSIIAEAGPAPGHTGPIELATAFTFFPIDEDEKKIPPYLPLSSSSEIYINSATQSEQALNVIQSTLIASAAARTAIYNVLKEQTGFEGTNGSMSDLAANPKWAFEGQPLLGRLPISTS